MTTPIPTPIPTPTPIPVPRGRKIHPHLDNPLDDVILRLTDAMMPALRATGHTPNIITGYSAVFGAAAVWALLRGHQVACAVLFMVSYFFDCVDGHFARTYDMVTPLGDKLDHIKDITVGAALALVLLTKYAVPWWGWAASALAYLLMLSHFGCQQLSYEARSTHDNETLDVTRRLCPDQPQPERAMRYTRWFGAGTSQLVFVAVILLAPRRA